MLLLKSMENIALDMRGRQNGICLFANFLVFVFNREGLHCSREILLRAPAVLRRLGGGGVCPTCSPVSVSATPKRAAGSRFKDPSSVCLLQLTARETEAQRSQGMDHGE